MDNWENVNITIFVFLSIEVLDNILGEITTWVTGIGLLVNPDKSDILPFLIGDFSHIIDYPRSIARVVE